MMNDNKATVRLALCGLGRIGRVHLKNILSNHRIKLTVVIEEVESIRREFEAQYGGVVTYGSLKEALEREGGGVVFDAVMICTPTYTHTDLIKEGLLAKKHILCEKPIGNVVETIDELYELAKAQERFLLTGFHRRFDPTFIKVKQAIEEKSVGQVYKVKTISRDNPVPSIEYLKISGGLVHDCASHDVDILRWLTGEEPESVYAAASCFDPSIKALEDFDVLEMIFRFPSGIIGTVDITRKAVYGYDQRIEVAGSEGVLRADNEPTTAFMLGTVDGFRSDPSKYSFPTRYLAAYAAELEHFVQLCLGEVSQPELTHLDLHNSTIILEAAAESAKTGALVQIKY